MLVEPVDVLSTATVVGRYGVAWNDNDLDAIMALQATMDGAVRAGERAADEVLARLPAPTTQEPDHAADT